jgi:hypothetical protein
MGCRFTITANGEALAMAWHLKDDKRGTGANLKNEKLKITTNS